MNGEDQVHGVVTVGTDHHRFDRLMDWLDHWEALHPGRVRWTVQHGSSRPMSGVAGYSLKPHADLLDDLRAADFVVTQGGPGGIMDSRACGLLPIVVPRLARLDEVVDDHQVAFAHQLGGKGLIEVAESEPALHALLDRALGSPASFAVTGGATDVTRTVATFERLVDVLVTERSSGPLRRRRRRRAPRS